MEDNKLNWVSISGERSRTYIFPNGEELTIEGVVRLAVRPTNHRLITKLGDKYIIPAVYLAIRIDADEWSA